MKRILSPLLCMAALVLTVGCCGAPDIAGKWNILKINGEDVVLENNDRTPFLEFNTSENRIHGFSGCNIINGSYTLEDNKLTFGNMATTMMAGPEQNMKTEATFLEALRKVEKVVSGVDKLKLIDSEGNVLIELSK